MIDWERVAILREEVGAEDFCEVVELFIDEVEDTINSLSQDQTPAEHEATMHFLAGSALNLGFRDLAEFCKSAETQAKQGECANVARLREIYTEARAAFAAKLAHYRPAAGPGIAAPGRWLTG